MPAERSAADKRRRAGAFLGGFLVGLSVAGLLLIGLSELVQRF